MARQSWLVDVVADAFRGVKGYRVDAVSGWSSRGRTDFYPEGVINHHTGPGSYSNLLNYMVYGSSISPLCNIATSRPDNGIVRITICTAGRANHAGVGELPWRRGQGSTGNSRTIGIENQNSGSQAWPQQQVEGIRILTAALLDHMGKPASRAIDHKTYAPRRKVDRYATDVGVEQNAIAKIMRSGIEPPDEWEVFWMSLSDKEKQVLEQFAGYLAGSNGTRGDSFARQFLMFNREERERLNQLADDIDEMLSRAGTSLQGVIVGGVNTIDAVRDLGYDIQTGERTGPLRNDSEEN